MTVLFVIGVIVSLIGGLLILVEAFRKSILWGLAVMLIPFVGLIFVFMNWSEAKRGFKVWLVGIGIVVLTGVIAGVTGQKPAFMDDKKPVETTSVETRPYTPSTVIETPPPSTAVTTPAPTTTTTAEAEAPPKRRMIAQVYADNETMTYYAEDCARRPPKSYRVAKTVAVAQGFKEAACP